MKLFDLINDRIYAPKLTRARIIAAIAVAVIVDALQLSQIPLLEQILDVVAMIATTWLIGFHVLLLPTLALEFIPVIDALPFWTGCVIAVIVLRGRQQSQPPANPPTNTLPPSVPPPKAIE